MSEENNKFYEVAIITLKSGTIVSLKDVFIQYKPSVIKFIKSDKSKEWVFYKECIEFIEYTYNEKIDNFFKSFSEELKRNSKLSKNFGDIGDILKKGD